VQQSAAELFFGRMEAQLHSSNILSACNDERIEALSRDRLRGIVTVNVQAGAT
jgi:hypothetical protein